MTDLQKFMRIRRWALFTIAFLIANACQISSPERFSELSVDQTGVDFINKLTPDEDLNIFNYLYFYDGGGVATGDLNGDELPDLFFTANQGPNKLFLNKSDFKFEDVTKQALDAPVDDWTTGVTFADINGDGKLDIYVCNLGSYLKIQGENKLYINQGNDENGIPKFEEKGKEYGLDLVGFSTQAVFFDYDLDGDLDMYQLNHSVHSNGTFNYSTIRKEYHPLAGDRLMRNDEGRFVDVTEEAGIYNSALGYGLGIGISDFNRDGYPDVYIGNDFHEDDYLYLNNGDGTFTESLGKMINHTSRSSMGSDLVDINNDGLTDIFSLDMLASDYEMLKKSAAEDPLRIYNSKLNYGYKHQFSRNTLQLNRGNGKFSEIGLLAGVYATDWSWAALGADFDNNRFVDLFVTNGIKGRTNELDYIKFISNDNIQYRLSGDLTKEELKLTDKMPEEKVPNFMFKNNGTLLFEDVSSQWGLDKDTFSSGAAYADFDLDGDLDIAINNVDQPASIYKNNSREKFAKTNYLKINLNGPEGNRFGIGAKIEIPLSGKNIITRELFPVRGYQSSVDFTLHVGLDSLSVIPELKVRWPGGKAQTMKDISVNQTLTVNYKDARQSNPEKVTQRSESILFSEITEQLNIPYKHVENDFVEFNREALIPHMISKEGPAIAVGDVNGDGLDDLFAGGAKRQPSKLYIQQEGATFKEKKISAFRIDSTFEDVDASFGDFDGDGDADLVVVSGGNEFYGHSEFMPPRLYLNDGGGNFIRDTQHFPDLYMTGSVVAISDIDKDNDLDLFIGARAVPWKYGERPESYLLINENGSFKKDTTAFGEKFSDLGLVTDAKWADMDNDGKDDLVVASEWSALQIIFNGKGKEPEMISNSTGLWNTVHIVDLDGDGRQDIVAGNLGLNSKFKASADAPLRMYVNDFDRSGTVEQIITYVDDDGEERLFATKDELAEQLGFINKKFESYESFAEASLTQVLDQNLLENALVYSVNELRSSVFYNMKDGYKKSPLPIESQFAPVYDFLAYDFNGDGRPDLLGVGNFFEANIQRGRYDAGYGNVLLNNGERNLKALRNQEMNWYLEGQIRHVQQIKINGKKVAVFAENDKPLRFFEINQLQDQQVTFNENSSY